MIYEITTQQIFQLLCKQLGSFFLLNEYEKKLLHRSYLNSLKSCEHCFSKINNKYYKKNNKTYFNPYHSAQYSIFLYFLSNQLFKISKNYKDREIQTLADKVYYLNKTLNGIDLFYEVNMPKIFVLDHPVGTVIGRAKIKNYFSFSSNCLVGSSRGKFPEIGYNVYMSAGSSILGDCLVGNNVIFSANSCIIDTDIPNNSLVIGQHPNTEIKKIKISEFYKILKINNLFIYEKKNKR